METTMVWGLGFGVYGLGLKDSCFDFGAWNPGRGLGLAMSGKSFLVGSGSAGLRSKIKNGHEWV